MSYQQNTVGHGYNQSMLRVEYRPQVEAYTKEEITEILDTLAESGVESWWYSAAAKGSFPLFPSKVLPFRTGVDSAYYRWVTEEAHRRGMTIFSWEYLNTAPLLAEKHPEWRVRYLEGPELVREERERHGHFVCFLSPYGQLLKEYCVEVINELGFDGIWFDGCYMFGPADDGLRWSCCCERCAEAFKKDTGLKIPRHIDWNDIAFRKFIMWRYDFFQKYWASLADYVRCRSKHGLLAFNHFNRGYMGAASGCALKRRKMDALMAGEGTSLTVEMQIKVLRAISNTYPPEVWSSLFDGIKIGYPARPNPDPVSAEFFVKAAATAGGFSSFGIAHPRDYSETLATLSQRLKPLAGYVGGKQLAPVGLVYSGYTKDFAYEPIEGESHDAGKHKPAVDSIYGISFLLNHLHFPFDIILDDQLGGELDPYEVILLPGVSCMQSSALQHLSGFVKRGGVLIVLGDSGTKNSLGEPRTKGVLDDLLGITARKQESAHLVLRPESQLLRSGGLPPKYMISGKGRLVDVAADVTVLATGESIVHSKMRVFSRKSVSSSKEMGVAISERKIGYGRAVFVAPNIGSEYAESANRRSREVLKRLIGKIKLPFTTDAPANVEISAWQQNDTVVLHILNKPASMYRLSGYALQLYPEDFTPTGAFKIVLPFKSKKVESVYNSQNLNVKVDAASTEIILQGLEMHETLVVTPDTNA